MQRITFAEAQRLINAGEAGYYCTDGVQIRPHATQIAVFVQWAWYLLPAEEFRLEDMGIIGNEHAWSRGIGVYIRGEDHPIVALLKADAEQLRVSRMNER